MGTAQKSLLAVLKGQKISPPPIWLMRQAGRYLPEYRALRKDAGSFMGLALNPEFATEVTLQPIRRFGFDGAILFSDILMIPHGLGQDVGFVAGEGPKLQPTLPDKSFDLGLDDGRLALFHEKLDPVYQTVAKLKEALPNQTTLLGFCGAPWTVASYMVEGGSSKNFQKLKTLAYSDPGYFQALTDLLVTTSIAYLNRQIAAGAEAVQIFESWGSVLSPNERERWSIDPLRRIAEGVKAVHPDTPIIVFPKGVGAAIVDYTGFADAIGLDTSIDPLWAAETIDPSVVLQGNLDPIALLGSTQEIDRAVDRILTAMTNRQFVFNLGHGILPETPIEHVSHLLERVRRVSVAA